MDASTGQYAAQITGLLAGEDLDVAAPCYIKSSDGLVYMSNATAANEAAEVVGFVARAVYSGQPCTLFGRGARFQYGTGLTPGNFLYVGATKGRLDSAAQLGDKIGVVEVIDATDIRIMRTQALEATLPPTQQVQISVRLTLATAKDIYVVFGHAGTLAITRIDTVIDAVLTTADEVLAFANNADAVLTSGGITLTQSGSAEADQDSSTPTANNTFTVGQRMKITTDGANGTATKVTITLTGTITRA